jgi:hypothetical protein
MNEYNREQSEAIIMVWKYLKRISPAERRDLRARIRNYLAFRKDVDRFLKSYFGEVCTETCYQSLYSACCTREGITTFFADVVINILMSPDEAVDGLLQVLGLPNLSPKCVYLGSRGCLWRVKPIVCAMFVCEHARKRVFDEEPGALKAWEGLKRRSKRYTWPNRPVLFDDLETYFIEKGYESSLMYCHNSPGLLRLKAQAKNQANRKAAR